MILKSIVTAQKFLSIKLAIIGASSFITAAIIETRDTSILLPVWVAIIIGGSGIVGPLLGIMLQGRARHKDKLENWAREDARAKRLAEAAQKVADTLTETTNQQNGQLKQIHILVNSNLTEAMRAELNSTSRELASLRLIVDMNREQGREPTIEALAVIESTQKRISELEEKLKYRVEQAVAAEAVI